jgi:hypothetical protein
MPLQPATIGSIMAQSLKRHLPLPGDRVTSHAMLLLAAAAIAASAPNSEQGPVARPIVQARAAVRIVSAARLHLDGLPGQDAPAWRLALIKTAAGLEQAKLIEFE